MNEQTDTVQGRLFDKNQVYGEDADFDFTERFITDAAQKRKSNHLDIHHKICYYNYIICAIPFCFNEKAE